mmetsp:Transcript_24484/g.35061  ORF Transcript_24484/g.35061 Transcript_24484/m.35061 type:complete len:91 (+) Transcript_24484:101-373(+)
MASVNYLLLISTILYPIHIFNGMGSWLYTEERHQWPSPPKADRNRKREGVDEIRWALNKCDGGYIVQSGLDAREICMPRNELVQSKFQFR